MKKILGLLIMLGLMVSFGGCGGDSDSPTGPSEEVTKGPEGQTLEVKTEEWDNGNIKVEFQFYRDGGSVVKHGYYKAYGEDGTLLVEGTYYEGKEKYNGKWVEYYRSGQIERESNYKDGDLDGKYVAYHENGQIEKEINYKDGEVDGKWVYYYESGKVEGEGNYVDEKQEGKEVWYDEEGNIISESCYDMGDRVDCP